MSFNLKIYASDITGGWPSKQCSIQKGHIAQLKTNFPESHIKTILWDLGDGNTARTKRVRHVFVTPLFNIPGEGYVTVKVTINGIHKAKKRLLIVPEVDCQIQAEVYNIKNETESITLNSVPLCAPLNLGNPINGKLEYACGGACPQDCPRYEIVASPIQGTTITKYGVHTLTSKVNIRGPPEAHVDCVKIYQNNLLGRKAKYPPITAKAHIVPSNLNITYDESSKEITINNLSQAMFPSKGLITWQITNTDTNDTITKKTKTKTITHDLGTSGTYQINASIKIPQISSPVEVTRNLTLPLPNTISLRIVNNSEVSNLNIVILQKNVADAFGSEATAWSVVPFSKIGDHETIQYENRLEAESNDSFGNISNRLVISAGQLATATSGGSLSVTGTSVDPSEIEILNGLTGGTIDGNIYRSDKLLAQKTSLAPNQKGVYEFKPTIWIGNVPAVSEGDIMNSTIVSNINTEISLLGIASADIVVTEGGVNPITFSLDNITF